MKNFSFFTTIFLGLSLLAASSRADQVDAFLKTEMEKRQIPGLAVMVIRDGKPAKSAAYGFSNLELKTPATLKTVFEIGSVTKQFTAAAILLLQQDGKLSVADKISQHIPGVPASWANITVSQLLHHTSGIKSYMGLDGFELNRKLTQSQFIAALAPVPLEFAPGDQWKYSNSGYSLLGYIIENVSGKNYWDFMGERIFVPLQMTTATNREPSLIIPNRADGYEKNKGQLINRDYDLTDIFAAGAIVGTVGDLAKWNAALDSEELLNAASKKEMWTSGVLNNGKPTQYGFGWRLDDFKGHQNIGHSGSTSGFSATLQRFPSDKLSVIVLCNSGELNVATSVARSVAEMYFTKKGTAQR